MDVAAIYDTTTRKMFDATEENLGPHTSYCYHHDPRHLAFTLSRYKFCAKLLAGKKAVLEVGCGDGFGVPLVADAVGSLVCIDWDPRQTAGNRRRLAWLAKTTFETLDITRSAPDQTFDAAYSIDVIEHIDPADEGTFMDHICRRLTADGVLIIGTPNQAASHHCHKPEVADQHINLYDGGRLEQMMRARFGNVFLFGMNDEVVHTGFLPMAHYLWALGVGPKQNDVHGTTIGGRQS